MYIADLHIHSRYSRATSRDCTPEHLDLWARRKGIHILGTGDFTHPGWRQELEDKLAVLSRALEDGGPAAIRAALHQVVPTFHEPEEVNREQGQEVQIPPQQVQSAKVLPFQKRQAAL